MGTINREATGTILRGKNATGRRVATLSLGVALILAAGVARAQEAAPSSAGAPPPPIPADDLDRGTPRRSILAFLKACRDGDYERAAQYLDLSDVKASERAARGPTLARHLKVVIDQAVWIDPPSLSDTPEGDPSDGVGPRRDRVGTAHTKKEPMNILLERVQQEDGVWIWKVWSATVAKIPALYGEFGYGPLGDLLPEPFFTIGFLDVELWQWIGLLLVVVAAVVLSWIAAGVIAPVLRPLVTHFRSDLKDRVEQLIVGPVRLGIGIILFYIGSFLLGLSLTARAFFHGTAKAIVIAAVSWLILRFIDIAVLRLEASLAGRQRAALSMLPLGRRTAKACVLVLAAVALLQNFNFDVGGLLAGLGVGGLAVALAAQETVKNFFGGVTLIADQPVRVGDFCRFGSQMGFVEDISIWSTRIRTLERTVVSIPNGQFVGMALENFARRDRMWLNTTIGVQYGLDAAALRGLVGEIAGLLRAHPKVHHESARARFAGFGSSALQVEISAYVLTASLNEFLAIREEIFLTIVDAVTAAGSRVAAP